VEPIEIELSYVLEVVLENLGDWCDIPFDYMFLKRVWTLHL